MGYQPINQSPPEFADWSDAQLEAEIGRRLQEGWEADHPYVKKQHAQQAQELLEELERRRGVSFRKPKRRRKRTAPGAPLFDKGGPQADHFD
jgi:hypothetical protein